MQLVIEITTFGHIHILIFMRRLQLKGNSVSSRTYNYTSDVRGIVRYSPNPPCELDPFSTFIELPRKSNHSSGGTREVGEEGGMEGGTQRSRVTS